jgi:hypothetical protein
MYPLVSLLHSPSLFPRLQDSPYEHHATSNTDPFVDLGPTVIELGISPTIDAIRSVEAFTAAVAGNYDHHGNHDHDGEIGRPTNG